MRSQQSSQGGLGPSGNVDTNRGAVLGTLSLVLHCHMPYVEGFGTWPFGEEWLWEALACVYLPLLQTLRGRRVTLVVSPVLADQLEALAGPAGERFLAFLREVRAPLHARAAAAAARAGDVRAEAEIARAARDYEHANAAFVSRDGRLLGALAELADSGVEMWTTSATHAILPLIATADGIALQLDQGISAHERRFGTWDGGLWLPECAFAPGLQDALAARGVRAFCVEEAAFVATSSPGPLGPATVAAGSRAVPIDRDLGHLVWNDTGSYPSAAVYRAYDIATLEAIHLWRNDGASYDRSAAMVRARRDASHFAECVAAALRRQRTASGRAGSVCVALDAEVLGHWWYEGQVWLQTVFSELSARHVRLSGVLGASSGHAPPPDRALQTSSWGAGNDLSTWTAPAVTSLRRTAVDAEHAFATALRRDSGTTDAKQRAALARAARELLALQASDWPYLISRGDARVYASERFRGHTEAFGAAINALAGAAPAPRPSLRNLAPFLDVSTLLATAPASAVD